LKRGIGRGLKTADSLIAQRGRGIGDVMASFFRFVRVVLILGLLFVGAVAVPLKIFDENGVRRVERLRKELSDLNETDATLRRENELLREQIRAFHADPNYIEKIARDELGMVGPDEIVYQFSSF
jgi:cell division protein FtsB